MDALPYGFRRHIPQQPGSYRSTHRQTRFVQLRALATIVHVMIEFHATPWLEFAVRKRVQKRTAFMAILVHKHPMLVNLASTPSDGGEPSRGET